MQASSATHPLPVRVGSDNPLDAVLRLGWRASRFGLIVGMALAVLAHAAALVVPVSMLLSMHRYVTELRQELREYFVTEYDIDVLKEEEKAKEEEPEPEPEPVPDPEPQPIAQPEPEEDPYEDPAPAPAEAPDALTSETVDLTGKGWDIVNKDGSKSTGGGYTSEKGTSKKPVRRKARIDGKEGGTGTGPAKPRPKVDRKRDAMPVGGRNWNCPFPPQADLEQVDHAAVIVSVTVAPDGTPQSVRVVSDPGYGFGQMAKRCALTRRYSPALDSDGKAITAATPQIRVTFTR